MSCCHGMRAVRHTCTRWHGFEAQLYPRFLLRWVLSRVGCPYRLLLHAPTYWSDQRRVGYSGVVANGIYPVLGVSTALRGRGSRLRDASALPPY